MVSLIGWQPWKWYPIYWAELSVFCNNQWMFRGVSECKALNISGAWMHCVNGPSTLPFEPFKGTRTTWRHLPDALAAPKNQKPLLACCPERFVRWGGGATYTACSGAWICGTNYRTWCLIPLIDVNYVVQNWQEEIIFPFLLLGVWLEVPANCRSRRIQFPFLQWPPRKCCILLGHIFLFWHYFWLQS